jgi:HEAT repeat protein
MTRRRLLLLVLAGLVGGAVTLLLVDRDKRLSLRVARYRCDRTQYVHVLLEYHRTGNERVKNRVLTVFERMDESPVPDLIEVLKDGDPDAKQAALAVLKKFKNGDPGIKRLLELLGDDDLAVQDWAATLLMQWGADMVPPLEAALTHPNRQVCWWAITTLGKINPATDATTKGLNMIVVNNPDVALRVAAISALGEIGVKSKEYVPTLVKMLEHQDAETRAAAARALGMIGANTEEAIPNLTLVLADEDAVVRANAWEAIQKIQARSQPGKPAIR